VAGRRRGGGTAVRPIAPQPDGIRVRFVVATGPWAEDIPPVPEGFGVTVSFGSENVAHEHGDALRLLGYTVVELPPVLQLSVSQIADFLVSAELMGRHPTYWRSLASRATRAYHLSLGPAAALVGGIVDVHVNHGARLTSRLP
jgi:hypothetical protein